MKVSRPVTAAVVATAVWTSGACAGTETEDSPSNDAKDAALADSRIPQEWREGGTTVVEPAEDGGYLYWSVTHELPKPRDHSDWPSEVCAIPHGYKIHALHWWISADGQEIVAMSPKWGEISCLD